MFAEAIVNGQPGLIAKTKIQAFHSVINPDKLTHLGSISGIARLSKRNR